MKRALSFAIILIMVFSLAACKQQQTAAANPTEAPVTPTEVPTEAPVDPTEPPETTAEPDPTEVPRGTPMPERIFEDPAEGSPKVIPGENVFFISCPDGSLYGWGSNEYGQLGLGDTDERRSPVFIGTGLTPTIVGETVFAMDANGTLWGWGRNDLGQLGLGDAENRLRPAEIMSSVKQIYKCWGGTYCVLTEAGELYRMGADSSGKDTSLVPLLFFDNVEYFDGRECVITNSGELWLLMGDWTKISDDVGMVYDVWTGVIEDIEGKLCQLDYESNKTAICEGVRSVAVADGAAYILMEDGSLFLYYADPEHYNVPEENKYRPNYLMNGVAEIMAEYSMGEDWGYDYYFALKANGELWARSSFSNALVGKPEGTYNFDFECVATDVRKVVTNGASTYILKANGEIWATGMSGDDYIHGSLGDGTIETRSGFVKLDLYNMVSVTSGFFMKFIDYDDGTDGVELYSRTFAVDADGRIWAWGWNGDGLLGVDSLDEDVLSPMEVKLAVEN